MEDQSQLKKRVVTYSRYDARGKNETAAGAQGHKVASASLVRLLVRLERTQEHVIG